MSLANPHHARARLLAAGALSAVVAASTLMAPAPANAAWTWTGSSEGGKQQICKKRVDGKWKVRMRIDNRRGDGKLSAAVSVVRNDKIIRTDRTSARAGKISEIASVKARRGDTIQYFLGNNYGGGGGERGLGQIKVC